MDVHHEETHRHVDPATGEQEDHTILVRGTLQPGERQTRHYPGASPHLEDVRVKCLDCDVGIDPYDLDLEQLADYLAECEAERAEEARAMSRMDETHPDY